MKYAKSLFFAFFILLPLLFTPVSSSSTKRAALLGYLDSLQVSDSGFKPSTGSSVTLEATADALMTYRFLGEQVEHENEIIYYIQRCQSGNGGFGASPGAVPSLEMTYQGIRAIQALNLNQSWIDGNIDRWKILNYTTSAFNETYELLIFPETSTLHEYTITELDALYSLIYISFFLETIPAFNVSYVTLSLLNLQYSNGSYSSFDLATRSIKVLYLINSLFSGFLALEPSSLEGANAFIHAFKEKDGGYSNSLNSQPTLISSFHALSTLEIFSSIDDPQTSSFILDKQLENGGFASSDNPTVKDSWLAIASLFYLESIDELQAPNIPQTEGFISLPMVSFYALVALGVIILRRKK